PPSAPHGSRAHKNRAVPGETSPPPGHGPTTSKGSVHRATHRSPGTGTATGRPRPRQRRRRGRPRHLRRRVPHRRPVPGAQGNDRSLRRERRRPVMTRIDGLSLTEAEHAIQDAHPGWHVWHSHDGKALGSIYATTTAPTGPECSGVTLCAPSVERI